VASESLHESIEDLTPATRNLHRAITSLMEEWEAVDWYQQRVDATDDEALKAVLAHNRDEEIEHAMMNLEWIRRNVATVDEAARTYLFTEGPITEIEAATKAAAGGSGSGGGAAGGGDEDEDAPSEGGAAGAATTASPSDGSLGIGSLKLT
jgi:uncharacterized protein